MNSVNSNGSKFRRFTSNVKGKISSAYDTTKRKAKEFKTGYSNRKKDLDTAFQQGYYLGYNSFDVLPNRFGILLKSMEGYYKGLRARKNYLKNYKKGEN